MGKLLWGTFFIPVSLTAFAGGSGEEKVPPPLEDNFESVQKEFNIRETQATFLL